MKNIIVRQLVLGAIFLGFASQVTAQVTNAKNKSPFPVKYTSAVDKNIILKTITLAPVYDNVNGIYSKPIQKLLIDLLQNDKVWGYSEFPNIEQKIFVENFDSKPNEVLDVLSKTGSQGLITALITKGPRGLNARLKLYTADQGMILLEESFQDLNTFEVSKLRDEFVTLYHGLKNKLPYRGFVLSRRALDVTLNLGSQNGVSVGQELTLAQILKLNRHPKLKTLVGIEREIIGRVKVTKVEPYLSFAQITFEKEAGVVDVGAKVLPTEDVAYPMPILNNEGDVIGDEKNKSSKSTTADETKEKNEDDNQNDKEEDSNDDSTPQPKNNQTGKATLQGGIAQYSESTSLVAGRAVEASQAMAPTFLLGGQLWFFNNFFVDFNIRQSYFTADHSVAGVTPKSLSYTNSRYTGAVGYTYFIDESINGSQISGEVGMTSYKTEVTATTPTVFTSTQADGLTLKVFGSMPLTIYPIDVGGNLQLMLNSTFSESPVTSGSSSAAVTSFGAFTSYKYSNNLKYRFDLTFENISANFSGTGTRTTPASSTTIRTTALLAGIEYLF